jgi:hypothetical protein
MVLRQSATVVGVGILVGAAGGFALSRLLAAGVPELQPAGAPADAPGLASGPEAA